jgi:hypothetical protein
MGINLSWATTVPALSLAASPITLTLGPVIAYNVLAILAPSLAAWTAYVLCRHVTKDHWASLMGGYIFGFSSYELGHLYGGHLNLAFSFVIPLLGYLILLRLAGALKPHVFIFLLSLALVLEFALSAELFATTTMFTVMAFILAFLIMPAKDRACLKDVSISTLCAFVVATDILIPYLYRMAALGTFLLPSSWGMTYSSDLLNFVVPTTTNFLGARVFGVTDGMFLANDVESGAYIGAPLLLILGAFVVTNKRDHVCKFLILSLALICLASLGPSLRIGRTVIMPLPWALFSRVPLIGNALPARFMGYAFLAISLVTAMWLRERIRKAMWVKWGLALLSLVFLLPNASSLRWRTDVHTPSFFSSGLYKQYLHPGESVLVVPYGITGQSMLWQAQTGMYFRMVGGYLGPVTPPDFYRWPIAGSSSDGLPLTGQADNLRAFLSAHEVTAVVVVKTTPGSWGRLFSVLGTEPVSVADVVLYKIATTHQ